MREWQENEWKLMGYLRIIGLFHSIGEKLKLNTWGVLIYWYWVQYWDALKESLLKELGEL